MSICRSTIALKATVPWRLGPLTRKRRDRLLLIPIYIHILEYCAPRGRAKRCGLIAPLVMAGYCDEFLNQNQTQISASL